MGQWEQEDVFKNSLKVIWALNREGFFVDSLVNKLIDDTLRDALWFT